MRKYLLGITIFAFCLVTSSSVFAQADFNVEPNITIAANPEDPREGEEVGVRLTSYETNLDLAYMKWSYGNQTKSGYGVKDFTITASPVSGAQNGVTVEITLENGSKIEKSISFASSSYDMTWEATGVKTIPFYLGKRIPVRESSIRVAVLTPEPAQTSYVWSKNGKSLKSGSSNFIDFKNSEIEKSEKVSLSIVKPNTSASTNSIDVPFVQNKTLFYEYTPITGLLTGHTVKDSVIGYDNTVSIFALPLGINKVPKPNFSWRISGVGVNNQEIPALLSFIQPDESGVVSIESNINNTKSLYQEFKSALGLNF